MSWTESLIRALVIQMLLLLVCGTAFAQGDEEPPVGVGVFIEVAGAGNTVTGDLSPLYPNTGYQVGGTLGVMSGANNWRFGVDLDVFYFDSKEGIPIGAGVNLPETTGVTFLTDVRLGYVIANRFQLYGKLGIGGIYADVAGLSATNFAFAAGGGAQYYFTDRLYLLFDSTWVTETASNLAYQQVRYGGGLGVSF